MTELSWVRLGLHFSALGLISVLTAGCPGNNSTTTGGGGAGAAGGSGGTGAGGTAGTGGSTCQPMTEICDMQDNDCNGVVDDIANPPPDGCKCNDGQTQECYTGPAGTEGTGECKKGSQTCTGGQWGTCTGEVVPASETCNLKDDDCNDLVDDGLTEITCGVGACQVTVAACVDGQAQQCIPGQPQNEVCDGIDNNCNQIVDETDPQVNQNCLTTLPGACAAGKFQCNAGVLECVGAMPGTEACDGIDNDCNGATDDNIPGTGGMCSSGQPGVCAPGVISCLNMNGNYTVDCFPLVQPSMDVCDGLDNNCNGLSDENDPGGGGVCNTGAQGICAPGVLHCENGAIQCVADNMPATETCNAQDDDCDGTVDDGNPGGGVNCPTMVPGLCATGVTSCTNGNVVCNQTVFATAEICNGLDENCNGQIDDGNPGGGAACSTGLLGVCAAGTITCQSAQLSCKQNVLASAEICGNAIDENCDGVAQAAPTTYFSETFANNNAGWTLGTGWGIGPAVAGTCASSTTGNDPGTDHTSTADNGIAGAVIGGCYPTTAYGDTCITSPNINLSGAPGNVFLSYWRHLHTDYPSFVTSKVDVSANGGTSWTTVYSVPSGQFQNDANWTQASFNVTAQKSATFRIRFCYASSGSGVIAGGGWNVDDVALTDVVCQ
ncbi:MAG: hypothetical protein IPK82_36765 [Polyangiaceae bacterium]|nr:hypothetical protein [Polyangiaceae bacterium]